MLSKTSNRRHVGSPNGLYDLSQAAGALFVGNVGCTVGCDDTEGLALEGGEGAVDGGSGFHQSTVGFLDGLIESSLLGLPAGTVARQSGGQSFGFLGAMLGRSASGLLGVKEGVDTPLHEIGDDPPKGDFAGIGWAVGSSDQVGGLGLQGRGEARHRTHARLGEDCL